MTIHTYTRHFTTTSLDDIQIEQPKRLKHQKRYQSRNQPCRCGSGKKAKKCCVYAGGSA